MNNWNEHDESDLEDPENIEWATEMREKYPRSTNGLTLRQVMEAWIDYSDEMCAGWMVDTNEDNVASVMQTYRLKHGLE